MSNRANIFSICDRAYALNQLGVVDYCIELSGNLRKDLDLIKPNIIVKGEDHVGTEDDETLFIKELGIQILYSSGSKIQSDIEIIRGYERLEKNSFINPWEFFKRQRIDQKKLENTLSAFKSLKVLVIGDLIIDEYIYCQPLGLSREDSNVVVSPFHRDIFLGGAGIASAHARGLGASVTFLTVVGDDELGRRSLANLRKTGVDVEALIDTLRPTTLKQRYKINGHTKFRLSELSSKTITQELQQSLMKLFCEKIQDVDLLIFADFNYGILPKNFVNALIGVARRRKVVIAADCQSSSQDGNITKYQGIDLITPTEHEARQSLNLNEIGLNELSRSVMKATKCMNLILTLGQEGILISHKSPRKSIVSDSIPALNKNAVDISGAGDSLLVASALGLAAGADIWEASYFGSIAAAIQVGRVGNISISYSEILQNIEPV
jgi:rfaE bifunctional protein kinase chain/domain